MTAVALKTSIFIILINKTKLICPSIRGNFLFAKLRAND